MLFVLISGVYIIQVTIAGHNFAAGVTLEGLIIQVIKEHAVMRVSSALLIEY